MWRARSVIPLIAALGLLLIGAGCGSDEDDAGSENEHQNSQNQDPEPENEPENEWDPRFVEVADIVRPGCAYGACHGEPAAEDTSLEFGGNLDDVSLETVQDIFQNYEADDGTALVQPGDAEQSALYLVLVSEDEDVFMPRGLAPLPDADIAVIKDWIDDGATYQ